MFVLSNRRLGAASEVLVTREVAGAMLRATAAEVARSATSRWELELARWLEARSAQTASAAGGAAGVLDVAEVAWTPEHFDRQRRFLLDAIVRAHAAAAQTTQRAFTRWAGLIEAHPRASVQVGRRWDWRATV